jgi:hypothetical protein
LAKIINTNSAADRNLATAIDTQVASAFNAMLTAYTSVSASIFTNQSYTLTQALAAFVNNTNLSMTGAELVSFLAVIKGAINTIQPSTIVDGEDQDEIESASSSSSNSSSSSSHSSASSNSSSSSSSSSSSP